MHTFYTSWHTITAGGQLNNGNTSSTWATVVLVNEPALVCQADASSLRLVVVSNHKYLFTDRMSPLDPLSRS